MSDVTNVEPSREQHHRPRQKRGADERAGGRAPWGDAGVVDELEALVSMRLQHIRLTQRFAEIANDADSIDEGLAGALECFCRTLGWPLGHGLLQVGTSGRYVDSGVWWMAEGNDYAEFVKASGRVALEGGSGFIESVLDGGTARYIGADVTASMGPRAEAGRAVGLKCGVAFPILVHARVAGVLEFYSNDIRDCEPELLDALNQLGTQLGRVIEREEFERSLARIAQEERRRLGRELHDTLSQQLTGIGMLARSLERKLEQDDHAEVGRARALVETIQDARQQLRALGRGLNPVDVSSGTLDLAIADFAATTATTFNVACTYEESDVLHAADDFTANQLFYIIREAVHNAAKHAGAGCIAIEVTPRGQHHVELRVRDDGGGFDTDGVTGGMGLRTLRYRARLIGGRLRVVSAPGRGTSVICLLKLNGDA